MHLIVHYLLIITLCQVIVGAEKAFTLESNYAFEIPSETEELLQHYCYDCHDAGTQKGDVQLDNLESLAQPDRLELLNKVLEQVYSGAMPTKKGEDLTEEERAELGMWAYSELKAFDASKLEDKLRYYRYGNYVNHEKLFRGDIKTAPYTPSRRWRINEYIYHERVNDIFELKGRGRRGSFHGVVSSFDLPTEPGVKYYDNQTIGRGQFLSLLANAKWIVRKQLRSALEKSGQFKLPPNFLETQKNNKRNLYRKFPDEAWNPRSTPEAIRRIVMGEIQPTDLALEAAIRCQFQLVLQREPTDLEIDRYLKFTKETLKISDAIIALEKMMVSVIMEPEFFYRHELGGGLPDEYGRVKLTPREASYAISYALTDSVPDASLVESSLTNRLITKYDYQREVTRLLEDDSIAKPRILRFFQDYFGYYGIYDVFKDEDRFVGNYNPHRVVSTKYIYRIPGKVSKEADALVEWILERDENVLETLLTTDKFFVHHTGDNEEMIDKAKVAVAEDKVNRAMYNQLKGLKDKRLKRAIRPYEKYIDHKGDIRRRFYLDMKAFEILYGEKGDLGRDRKPMPHLNSLPHSIKMYNLDYRTWSYDAVQPIAIRHRAGLLTHPAWLVSFSHNMATDPIMRGKWIREKLLGGFIPDVPISVDAKLPEDPHKTLREKFSITKAQDCRRCHEKMDPLGFTFEIYDDFGRARKQEALEHPENILSYKNQMERDVNGGIRNFKFPVYKTKPINPRGYLEGTGDKELDGEVSNAIDLMQRLAKSERVRQVFVRNVFRYFMGRNETLADSKTLISADKAYVESGGSFKALIVSLLTSDSFMYRK